MSSQRNPKNPVSSFYWNDWSNDLSLKLCGFAAKGLWMDCLSLAATQVPFGHLSIDGRPLTAEDLQLMLPGNHSVEEIAALLDELVEKGVASRTAKGVIYSRRMVRDAREIAVAKKNGKKGGNPSLRKPTEKPQGDNHRLNQTDNPNTSSLSYSPHPPRGGRRENATEQESGQPPWQRRVSGFRSRGFWTPEWGPPPDAIGCLVPAEYL